MQPAENTMLHAARAGSSDAFSALVQPHATVLRAHCYRMLGSAADADDALQETLVRAWRHLDSFEARASLRSWLLSIATRACLDALAARKQRSLPSFARSDVAGDPSAMPSPPVLDPVWIEPCTDARLFEGALDDRESPESRVTRRESVALAFVAALHWLPATQRAALLLHDVLGWQASEVADALDSSVAAVNSALQRARATIDEHGRPKRDRSRNVSDDRVKATVERYVRAWEMGDADALAAALCEDVTLAMPPVPTWFDGRADVVAFYRGFVLAQGLRFRVVPAPSCNGTIALAAYRADGDRWVADALHVIELDGDQIASVVVFMGEHAPQGVGLPPTLS